MTGIFLRVKNENGKYVNKEVEYLTNFERNEQFVNREPQEIVNWLHALCNKIVEVEEFLNDEGYETKEDFE